MPDWNHTSKVINFYLKLSMALYSEILYSAWNFGHGEYDRSKYGQENIYISRFTPFFTILRERLIL